MPPDAPKDAPIPPRTARALAALLAIAVLLALAGLAYWRFVPSVPAAPPLAANPGAMQQIPSIEAAMPILQASADAWLPGAAPSMLSMQIDWPGNADADSRDDGIPPGGWVNAVFVAPWDAPVGRAANAATLAMLLDRGSGQIISQSSLSWETPPPQPPAWSEPVIGSIEALQIAERAAGRDFRLACPENRHLTRLSLLDLSAGTPRWLIGYEDSRAPDKPGLSMRIDAATGEILGVRADAPPCDDQPGQVQQDRKPREKKKKSATEPAG